MGDHNLLDRKSNQGYCQRYFGDENGKTGESPQAIRQDDTAESRGGDKDGKTDENPQAIRQDDAAESRGTVGTGDSGGTDKGGKESSGEKVHWQVAAGPDDSGGSAGEEPSAGT